MLTVILPLLLIGLTITTVHNQVVKSVTDVFA